MRGALGNLLVLLASAVLATGCPETPREKLCNSNDPDDPQCINDAGAGGIGLRIVTENGEKYIAGNCGLFAHAIQWQIPGGAPDDGAIVQHVVVTGNHYAPTLDDEPILCIEGRQLNEEYWELWEYDQDGVNPSRVISDTWGSTANKSDTGDIQWTAEASFYSDAEMLNGIDSFVRGGHPFAHDLKSTENQPAFWNNIPKPRLERTLKISWKCCPPRATRVVCGDWQGVPECN